MVEGERGAVRIDSFDGRLGRGSGVARVVRGTDESRCMMNPMSFGSTVAPFSCAKGDGIAEIGGEGARARDGPGVLVDDSE